MTPSYILCHGGGHETWNAEIYMSKGLKFSILNKNVRCNLFNVH